MGVVLGFMVTAIVGWIIVYLATENDNEGWTAIGAIMGIGGTLIFFFTSIEYDITSEWKVIETSHAKTQRMVIVDDGVKTWEFDLYKDVSIITDSSKFEFEHTTNFWGSDDIEGIRVKRD
jgi:Na+/melibiose symporter-like transporter